MAVRPTFTLKIMVILSIIMATSLDTKAFADDSIDALLNEADRALGHKPKENAPSADDKNTQNTPQRRPSRPKANPAPQAAAVSKPAQEQPPAQTPLTPIDPARVSEILALDLQAQERQRLAHSHGVTARVGFAYDRVPAVYQAEKDDDFFTFAEPATFKGISIDAMAGSPIGTPVGEGFTRGAAFWGVAAGAGLLQGSAQVRRTGIMDERTAYDYQLFPLDGGLSLGWSTDIGLNVWMSGGYAVDIVRQLGTGQTDTFTALFTGETLAWGASWRNSRGYEVFAQYRLRGIVNSVNREPTQSRIAGRVISLGIGAPI